MTADAPAAKPLRFQVAAVGWKRFAMAACFTLLCAAGALMTHRANHAPLGPSITLAAAGRTLPAPSAINADRSWMTAQGEFAYLLDTSSSSLGELRGEFAMLISELEM